MTKNTAVSAVEGLAKRVIPTHYSKFTFELCGAQKGNDTFEILQNPGKNILVKGNTGIAMARGLYHYLKRYCDFHLSWCGDNRSLPKFLPNIEAPISFSCRKKGKLFRVRAPSSIRS